LEEEEEEEENNVTIGADDDHNGEEYDNGLEEEQDGEHDSDEDDENEDEDRNLPVDNFWTNTYSTNFHVQSMVQEIGTMVDRIASSTKTNYKETNYDDFQDFFKDWSEAKQFLHTTQWKPNDNTPGSVFVPSVVQRQIDEDAILDEIVIESREEIEIMQPAPCYVRMLYESMTSFDVVLDKVDASGKLNKLIHERYTPQYIEAICWKVFVSLICLNILNVY
jgi:hypothetical protein